jgi:hypothetical protein
MRAAALLCALALAGPAAPASAGGPWEGRTAAFFGVSFLDTSHEGELAGPRADEAARVEMVEAQLAAALEAQGLELVPLEPVAETLALYANPADCSGCDVRLAAELGADYAVTSEVQKVSNLILAMNVVIRDAETGEQVRAYAVDIRSNTDESWMRGMRYILENGIFKE